MAAREEVVPPLPPGFVLEEDVPPLPPGFELQEGSKLDAFRAEQAARNKPKPAPPRGLAKMGMGEAALSLGTGAVALPVSGLMGLAGTMMPGPRGQGAEWATQTLKDMTYQPKTASGQGIVNTIAAPFEMYDEFTTGVGGKIIDAGGPPAWATGAKVGLDFLPALLAKGIGMAAGPKPGAGPRPPAPRAGPPRVEPSIGERPPEVFRSARQPTIPLSDIAERTAPAATKESKLPKTSIRHPANAVKLETFQEANKAGYVFPPTAIEENFVRGRIESVGGKAATKQEAIIRNQQTTNNLVRKVIGVDENTPITEGLLETQRNTAAAPYREIARLDAAADRALGKLKDARFDLKNAHNAAAKGDARAAKEVQRLEKLVEYYEGKIDASAQAAGRPELLGELRAARKRIAQLHDVERALNTSTGDIDARVLGRMYDKRGPSGMTGELGVIGRAANAFGDYVRSSEGMQAPGVSALEPLVVAGGTLAGGQAGAVAGSGLVLARGPARKLALSPRFQKPLKSGQPGISLKDVGRFAGNAAIPLALTPSLGLRVPEAD